MALMMALALAGALYAGPAAAQCIWGCACVGRSCGCNSNGSGERCDTGGHGCVVSMCDAGGMALLAPDGSPVRLAAANGPAPAAAVQSRWEYRGHGRSVARHCSGVVVARYFDRSAAAAVRARQRTLVI
jgi:hypothetical protein